jgi:hypothetical protein
MQPSTWIALHLKLAKAPVNVDNFHRRMTDQSHQSPERLEVMTLKQAAAYLRISKAHLSNVLGGKVAGVPPCRSFRLGRRILMKREWIDQWLESTHETAAK